MEVPRRVWVGLAVGLGLLVVGGVLGAVQNGMQEFYHEDCARYGFERPLPPNGTAEPEPLTPAQREACEDDLERLTAVDALQRAALGPGIALVALSGVYLVALAIAGRDDGPS